MSLSNKAKINAYINKNATSTIRGRGVSIYKSDSWRLAELDVKKGYAHFKVASSAGYEEYDVFIRNINATLSSSCSCPYDWGPMCKHEVSALKALELELEEWDQKNANLDIEDTEYEEVPRKIRKGNNKTTVKLAKISHLINYANTSAKLVNKGETYVKFGYIEKLDVIDTSISCSVFDGVSSSDVQIERTNNFQLNTNCTCTDNSYNLCEHKVAALLFIRKLKGEHFFEHLKDHSSDKGSLLEEYGYSLEDAWEDKFRFVFRNGQLSLQVLDKSIQKVSRPSEWSKIAKKINKHYIPKESGIEGKDDVSQEQEIGYGFHFLKNNELPAVKIKRIIGKVNADGNRFKAGIKDIEDLSLDQIPPQDEETFAINHLLKKISKHQVAQYLSKGTSSSFFYGTFSDEEFQQGQSYLMDQFSKLIPLLRNKIVGEMPRINIVKNNNFNQIDIASENINLAFELTSTNKDLADTTEDQGFIYLTAYLEIEDQRVPLPKITQKGFLFVSYIDQLYLLDHVDTAFLIQTFSNKNNLKVPQSNFIDFYTTMLLPLMKKYELNMDIDLKIEQRDAEMQKRIYITEENDLLYFTPKAAYGDSEADLFSKERILLGGEEKFEMIELRRDIEAESLYREELSNLHPNFAHSTINGAFALTLKDILRNEWFFKTFDYFKENEIEVFGHDTLKKFRYNPNRPSFNIVASSGIDWFDVKMDVQFGDQNINLKDIQKAILRNENFVRLGDGSIGLLPEDWLKKNEMLFKISDVTKDTLKVSKLHFSLLEVLFDEIDESSVFAEIQEKKKRLLNFDTISEHETPKEVKAELRDYQKSGFNWMCFLDEFGWGGCLADDMGLGKTLQILTFLQYKVNQNPKHTSLIILPTSLIFNWQDEIKKFCPGLTYMLHRGGDRSKDSAVFDDFNLIITSYGILVRDIEMLKEYKFDYIILDESQAIKNPNSKRYKAVRLLNSYNRLVLTGTPVENNTFDLFAQMNFLNPGLLGGMSFFKEEFSKPIDREKDEAKVHQLKKMVFPFLLRRTKEQVAPELPEKTESLLFCEMGTKQRKIYDAYKASYRDRILNKLTADGLQKTRFFVLEGLLKLRQICDSPALVNNVDETFGNDSIKIDTLMEHVVEKTGQHKILIFSQFVKMLGLIRKEMDDKGIVYEYLDGSVKSEDRALSVKRFQSDDTCRVFLISLKAGGFGLNLTEADYVYLIDPWWNPAVEMQAIDRTHRIGQTKNVFSYKMICKDSIEEKVLKLQNKKKALVTDLISAESGFFKSLSKDDIEDLFS